MKVLITGADGQLGRALAPLFPEAIMARRQTLDISSPVSVDAFDFSGVEAVINAAAFTAVDAAEVQPGLRSSWAANVSGVALLAATCRELDIPLVQVSTDYVFDGAFNAPIDINATMKPQGVYGIGKAASEFAAQLAPKHYVVRTSWVFGDGPNFVRTMLRLAESHGNVSVVSDQYGRPTLAADLAAVIAGLLAQNAAYGTYHATNSGDVISWADFAREIFKVAGNETTVTGISSADYARDRPTMAPRPAYSALDLACLEPFGLVPRPWPEALAEYVKTLNKAVS